MLRQTAFDRRAALVREAEGERLARSAKTDAFGAEAIRRALALLRSPQVYGAPLGPALLVPERNL